MTALPPTKRVLGFLTTATNRGTEATLEELFDLFELSKTESTLAKVMSVGDLLEGMGLCLIPDLRKGELDSVRRIFPKEIRAITPDIALSEIANKESPDLELKSSLMYHHARAANNPATEIANLKSDDVIHSCLKTVAAFLTSGGGVIYVGVDDACKILGLEFDFELLGAEKRNEDGWELQLRNLITGNFKDGDNVNDYVSVRFLPIQGRCVSRVEVGPRRRLSFLRWKNAYHLFRRQGNRTEEIAIEQIEEYLALKSARL
jgi:hypothetical protein